ncbi:ABC transporter substrate-binding protein [Roseomonas sp. F4]
MIPRAAAWLLAVTLGLGAAEAQTLRIGLRDDPDILDPTLARTFVGRTVFAGLCDKLVDLDEKLEIVPQLATAWRWEDPTTLRLTLRPGVTFHDGTPMDAAAVQASLQRHATLQGSFRRAELTSLAAVEVVDPLTVVIRLSAPSAPFLSQLADRSGMILSPTATAASGRDFGLNPVCAGPFRFTQRVAQDRIVLDRFPGYWDAGRIHLDRVTFQAIPDNTARRANLQAGSLDLIFAVEPEDAQAMARNPRLRVAEADELGYQLITINLGNGPRADTPMGRDARVRQAFDAALDRQALNQVIFAGQFTPTVQAIPPSSAFHLREATVPPRDLARARALLQQAGVALPVRVEMTVPNNPDLRQAGEMIQAMVREAGFELRLAAMEYASQLNSTSRGAFETTIGAWSGRPDPDGNVYNGSHSAGATNDGKYANPEVDRLLDAARAERDPARRREMYAQVWRIAIEQDRSRIYLWHRKNIIGYSARLNGLRAHPDGLVRFQDVRLD